jgi:hypothetical protein
MRVFSTNNPASSDACDVFERAFTTKQRTQTPPLTLAETSRKITTDSKACRISTPLWKGDLDQCPILENFSPSLGLSGRYLNLFRFRVGFSLCVR